MREGFDNRRVSLNCARSLQLRKKHLRKKQPRPRVLTSDANRKLSVLDRELIEKRIHAYWGMRSRGEVIEIASLIAADCVYVSKNWLGGPADIRREGREACFEWARHINAMVETLKMKVLRLLIDGEQAVACRRMTYRNRGSRHVVEVIVTSYMRFRGGEMLELIDYPDPLAMRRLMGD